MQSNEIRKILTRRPFQPVRFIMSSGDSYRVNHPELAILTDDGSIYVFRKESGPENASIEIEPRIHLDGIISVLHINGVEEVRDHAA